MMGEISHTQVRTTFFKFKKDTTTDDINRVVKAFFELKKQCVDVETKKPYILSFRGGLDNGSDNLNKGFSHSFVIEFKSTFDRDYYANADPAHQSFKDMLNGMKDGGVEEIMVLDFEDGVY